MRGRCFRCLSSRHRFASCKEPRVCWSCEKAGHLARDCKQPSERPREAAPHRHRSTLVSPGRSFAEVLMVPVRGDLSGRRPLDRGRDRDGGIDNRCGSARSHRRDGGKYRRPARSGRAEPYPAHRVVDSYSCHEGRRRAGGPIRNQGRRQRATCTSSATAMTKGECAAGPKRPSTKPAAPGAAHAPQLKEAGEEEPDVVGSHANGLATPRLLKEGVDAALQEENDREGLLLLMEHGDMGGHDDPDEEELMLMAPELDECSYKAKEVVQGNREPFEQGPLDQLSLAVRELLDVTPCEWGHVGEDEEAEVAVGEMKRLAPDLDESGAELSGQAVLLDDEARGAELGEHVVGGEHSAWKEAGQQFEKEIVMPAQAGSGQQDLEMGTPLCSLSGFLARIMTPLEPSVLSTPAVALALVMEVEAPSVRKSARIAKLHPDGANIEQLAKDAVARRLGSQPEEVTPSERQRQDYLALWDGPLTDQAAAAIDDLVLSMKKSKKKKKSGTGIVRQMPPGVA